MKRKILLGVCLLFGLMLINSGFNKFFNYMPMPANMPESMTKLMAALMQISWLMPLVAIAEIVGGVLFIIPKFRALGAIIVFLNNYWHTFNKYHKRTIRFANCFSVISHKS